MNKRFLRSIVSIVILSILILVLVILIITPTVKSIKAINADILGQRTLLESRYKNRLNTRESIQNYNQLSPKIPELTNAIFLRTGAELEFITALEAIANKYSVSQTINFDTKNGEAVMQNKRKVPIEISLNGDYLDILKYLDNLAKTQFYLIIENMSIASKTSDISGSVRALLKGYTYWQK